MLFFIICCLLPTLVVETHCATDLYVMPFTSGISYAGSNYHPYIEIDLKNLEDGEVRFYDNPGNDMLENKGDLWKFAISAFNFQKSCIWKDDIHEVSIKHGGADGWNIKSIITMLRNGSNYVLLTADMEVNRWVDGDRGSSYNEFTLSLR